MDLAALRRRRSAQRRSATQSIKMLEESLKQDPLDMAKMRAQLNTLQNTGAKLKTLDEEILDKLFEEVPVDEDNDDDEDADEDAEEDPKQKEIDEEVQKANEYQERIDVITLLVDGKLDIKAPSEASFGTAVGGAPVMSVSKQYRLPQIKLRKFSGELSDWLPWWSHFSSIHENQQLADIEKFEYLVQSMESNTRAKQLVDKYPMTADNYKAVIKALEERYGQEDLLIPHYIRELLKLLVQTASAKEKLPLSTLYDRIETDIRALGSLKVTTKEMERFLHPIIESCLSEEIYTAWQRSSLYEKTEPNKSRLDFLLQFLGEEARKEMKREARDFNLTVPEKSEQGKPSKRKKVMSTEEPAIAGLVAQSASGKACIFCDKRNHASEGCFRTKNMPLCDRREKCRAARVCFNCIKPGHGAQKCTAAVTCSRCSGSHVLAMCPNLGTKVTSKDEVAELINKTEDLSLGTEQSGMGVHARSDVLLKTARVKLVNPSTGKEVIVRVLFDDGSQKSYITGKASRIISSRPVGKEESRIILMDGSMTNLEMTSRHEIFICSLYNSTRMKMEVREKKAIGGPTSRVPFGPWIDSLRKLKIEISDLESHPTAATVDLLIGLDYYEQCRTGRRVKISDGLFAVETVFGWTLSGTLPELTRTSSRETSVGHLSIYSSNHCTEITKLWDLDVIGIQDSADQENKREHDQRVMEEFQSSNKRKEDGRYVVKLPWKNGLPEIPSNKEIALKRLTATTRKLSAEDFGKYNKIFQDWLKKGIIERVPNGEYNSGFYLPHRPVIKMESVNTPMRPVFDASCRAGKVPSINMLLETGMNMLEIIPSLLIKFRRFSVGCSADIKGAFPTVEVDDGDRNYQKFLWWENGPDSEIVEFRHCRVVFGLTCSPFMFSATLSHHLKNGDECAKLLSECLYVDNVQTSFSSVPEYQEFKEKSTNNLAGAQMILRQWESNCDAFHEKVDTSVLGLCCNKEEDALSIKIPKSFYCEGEIEVTSRVVLSMVSQLFDPIGIACPVTLLPRLLLQRAHFSEKKWDEQWEQEDSIKFREWTGNVHYLQNVKIPRFAFQEKERKVQFHIFCDGSMAAYASMVVVRVEGPEGITVKFLMGKSRVAPLEKKKKKKVSIPRLELLACTIGARMAKIVMDSLKSEGKFYFWSDSTTCIAWIKLEVVWGVFVDNRVKEIRTLTDRDNWRHIPGCANPADLPSRGCGPKEYLESSWWEGPDWLRLPESEWPRSSVTYNEEEVNEEKRKTIVSCHAVQVVKPRFSDYMKNVRVEYGWIRRYLRNRFFPQKRISSSFLTITEERAAELELIRDIQRRHFQEPPKVSGFEVNNENGIWRLKTRLTYLEDSPEFKNPIILPKNDPYVRQLVEYVHRTSYHGGVQYVLNKLRDRYWIIQGRSLVKAVVHKCVSCQKNRVKHLESVPAPLPEKRIETVAAFKTTGVDLAGPIFIKGGKKAWIVLYTCAVYRGVHLDLIDSLSTESFLLSLERFVNTVGRPSTVYSDNGTNFVGAVNLMKKLDWGKMTQMFGQKRITWTFIPPSGPWHGGWWERLIRTMKDLLKKMLGNAKMTYEEMRTCLAGVQGVMNERPLTEVTADAEDLRPLTPSMFIRDLPLQFPEGEKVGAQLLTESYGKMQRLKLALQARFRKEYLGFLTSRNLGSGSKIPEVGALVLVGDSNKKRYQWPLGRILELIPGKDGKVRVLRVKTMTGELVRPIQRIYPLELHGENIPKDRLEENTCESVPSKENAESETEEKTISRSGRIVKPPVRYGQWGYK